MHRSMETRSAKKRKLSIFSNNNTNIEINKEEEQEGKDYISQLPDALLHHVLFLLPIKTVAQTSVLSKRWTSLWSTFPDLDFTTLHPFSAVDDPNRNKPHSRPTPRSRPRARPRHQYPMDFIINKVLAKKCCDIRALRFRGNDVSFTRLNRLIRDAIGHNVQELDLDVSTEAGGCLNLPSCVAESTSLRVFRMRSARPGFRMPRASPAKSFFQSLHSLSLSRLVLRSPPSLSDMFSGHSSCFPLLKKLSLHACSELKFLNVSACRALEEMSVDDCFQLQGLDVSCAKLERLRVANCFDSYLARSWVGIEAPRLRELVWEDNAIADRCVLVSLSGVDEASVGFFVQQDELISMTKLQTVSHLFMALSHVRCLTLDSQCVEILSNNNSIAGYLQPFNNLKSLELHTGFNRNNVPGLACIFRSSPFLQTLILKIIDNYKIERRKWNKDLWDASSTEEEQFWESQTQSLKSFLYNLKAVKINGFLECENEVSLAKFLLKHGKALEEMTLCTGRSKARDSLRRQKIRSQIMGFSWASSKAKITFR